MQNQLIAKKSVKSPVNSKNLLTNLLKKQKALRLSDEKMASTLNCSRALWQLYRTHPERFPNFNLLRGIVTNYPELCIDVIEYLRGDGNE